MHREEQSWAERVHSGLPGGLLRAQEGRGLTSPPADFLGLTPPFWPKTWPCVRPTTDVCHGAGLQSAEGRSSGEGLRGAPRGGGLPPPSRTPPPPALTCRGALGQAR